MKKILFLLAVCFAFISCNMNAKNGTETQTQKEVTAKDHVEVLYFHGKQRCATCIAIENNTLAVMKENLAEQVKKGEVVFKVIDISKKENEKIKKALATFKGVRRRFSFQIREEKLVYIDDYAHHPTEINAVHQAVRELYPNKKIIACFQPHLFSRTKDFIDGFAESLSQFDEILLLEIYPARELPMEGVNSSWLLSKIKNKNKRLVTKEELLTSFKNSDANVFVTIGAGDIGEMVKDVKKVLNEKI